MEMTCDRAGANAGGGKKRRATRNIVLMVVAQALVFGAVYYHDSTREADEAGRGFVTDCIGKSVAGDLAVDEAMRDGRLTVGEIRKIRRASAGAC